MWQRFEIKRRDSNPKRITIEKNKEIGLLIHRNLAEALKLSTHFRENIVVHSSQLEFPSSLEISNETYLLYFIRENEIIRGRLFNHNKIQSDDDNVINVECNIVDPYISNTKFGNTLATVNNITNNKKISITIQIVEHSTSLEESKLTL